MSLKQTYILFIIHENAFCLQTYGQQIEISHNLSVKALKQKALILQSRALEGFIFHEKSKTF